jgi:hypothetical protein
MLVYLNAGLTFLLLCGTDAWSWCTKGWHFTDGKINRILRSIERRSEKERITNEKELRRSLNRSTFEHKHTCYLIRFVRHALSMEEGRIAEMFFRMELREKHIRGRMRARRRQRKDEGRSER